MHAPLVTRDEAVNRTAPPAKGGATVGCQGSWSPTPLLVLGEELVDALACRSQHVLGALDLRLRAGLGDLPRRGKHLVHEVAQLDEVVVGARRRPPPTGAGVVSAVCASLPASVSAKTRRPDSEAAGSMSPSSSSCCRVGYTEPGLGVQLPPLRSEITWMIW